MNKAVLAGHVGSVTVRTSQATFSLATKGWRKRQDGSGYDPETTWHQCVAFGRFVEVVSKWITTGTHLTLSGRIQNSTYDKDGVRHHRSEIVVEELDISPRAKAASAEDEEHETPPTGGDLAYDDVEEIPA